MKTTILEVFGSSKSNKFNEQEKELLYQLVVRYYNQVADDEDISNAGFRGEDSGINKNQLLNKIMGL